MVFGRRVAPLPGGEACDDWDVIYGFLRQTFAFQKPLRAPLASVAVFLDHLGKVLRGMFQRVRGVIGVFEAA